MKLILSLFLLFPTYFIAQKITLKGYAFDSTNEKNRVTVSINDTLHKTFKSFESDALNFGDLSPLEKEDFKRKTQLYNNIIKEKKAFVKTKRAGRFKIIADIKDSLIFNCNQCVAQRFAAKDLQLRKKHIFLKKIDCNSIKKCAKEVNYIFIIANKKSLKVAIPKNLCESIFYLDVIKLQGKYEIIKNYSSKKLDNPISFSVISPRNGTFKQYNKILILLKDECDDINFNRLQFFPVFKTKSNDFAAGIDYYTYTYFQSKSQIKPHLIDFDENEYIELNNSIFSISDFKEPLYKIENGRAYPKYGFTIDEAKIVIEEMK